jgi:predicted N-acetyltransferase YhbS
LPTPRQPRKEEAAPLAELIDSVFGLGKLYSEEQMVTTLRRAPTRRDTLIMVEDGRPVSHIRTAYADALVYGCRFRVASIGAVSTHPDYRGRGYADALLEESLGRMDAKRAKVLIVSGDRGLYRRAHCATAGRVFEAVLGPRRTDQRSPDVTVRRVSADDWGPLAPLHQTESVRFARPMGFMANLPFWWSCNRPEIWLIEASGRPAAYVMLAIPWGSGPTEAKREVHEYAGSRAALLDALPAIFEVGKINEVRVRALGHDGEMIHLLRRRGLTLEERPLGGTHRIIDLPGLMAKLRPYLRERLEGRDMRRLSFEQQGDRCAIAYGDQRIELSLSEAAPLVLGGPGAPQLSGELARILPAIFPVPFPQPGFNYA